MNKEEILTLINVVSIRDGVLEKTSYDPNLVISLVKLKAQLFLILELTSITSISNLKVFSNLKLESSKAQLNFNDKNIDFKSFNLR